MPVIIAWILGLIQNSSQIVAIAEAAYQLWKSIPWFHKPVALVQLRSAVKSAQLINDPLPIQNFHTAWSGILDKKP